MTRIEHANITVPDIDEAIRFIKIIAPDFVVRKDCSPEESYRWVHIGNDEYYFALQEAHLDANPTYPRMAYKNFGVNHISIVVDDLDKIESKLVEAGFKRSIETPKESYRRRLYFYDDMGFEWELIEYSSNEPNKKFHYE